MRVRTTSAAACAVLLAVDRPRRLQPGPGRRRRRPARWASTCRAPTPTSGTPTSSTSRRASTGGEVDALPLSNSQNDIAKLVSNVQVFTDQGAKAVVMAPQDTGAIAATLQTLDEKKIPVVSVDTRPDKGKRLHGRARRQPRVRREGLRVPRRAAEAARARSPSSRATCPRSTAATAPRRSRRA